MKLCDSKSFTVIKKFIIYSAWCHCLSFKLFQSPLGGGACYFSHTLIRSVSFSSTHLLKIVMTTSTFINIIFSIYAITIRWEKKQVCKGLDVQKMTNDIVLFLSFFCIRVSTFPRGWYDAQIFDFTIFFKKFLSFITFRRNERVK
jgi:hypothetical protein